MNDIDLFVLERLKTSMCATQYFNAEGLPEVPELCVDTAISWATQSSSPPLSILGQRFLRRVLSLSSYEKMVTKRILERIEDCEPSILLSLLTESLPAKSFLGNLSSRWEIIRLGLESLLENWASNSSHGTFRIQDSLKFWKRSLKALVLAGDGPSSSLSHLLNETCLLLIHTIDTKLPPNLAYTLIRLLQKTVEIAFYNNWSFALKPQPSCFLGDRMRAELLSRVSGMDLTRWISHDCEETPFDFNIRCYRLLLYTMARLLFAQGYQSSIVDHLAISGNDFVAIFQSDDELLIRMLLTLLLIENTAIKNGWADKLRVPSAHELFTSLLGLIGFDRYCLIDWLVSPETDCLAYLLAYTKRLAAASTITNDGDKGQQHRWRPPACWLQLHREDVRQVMTDLAKSLQTLQINGSLPFVPNLLITRIHTAVKALSSLQEMPQ